MGRSSTWAMCLAALLCGAGVLAWAQSSDAGLPTCSAPLWSTCDLVFPLQPGEDVARAELRAEFRSPHRDSRTLRAFRQGQTLVLRFSPDEAGAWDYRVTSNLPRLDAKIGRLTATESNAPGFVRTANVHHFQTSDLKPHLWMSSELADFAALPRAQFEAALKQKAEAAFNHVRVTIDGGADLSEAAARVAAINASGLVADLVLGAAPRDRAARRLYVTEMVARFAAFNVTWAGTPAFEQVENGLAIADDVGNLIAELDPYKHPRTSMAAVTSAPLAEQSTAPRSRGWMDVLSYGTVDPNVTAVEHPFYMLPSLNTGIQSRADLWNATMNGQYPAAGEGRDFKVWFDFMSGNRYWELEPYFDVQGGRAVALPEIPEDIGFDGLEAVEYVVYVEKPGPVELTVGKRGYDVAWIHPATGERIKAKDTKDQKGTTLLATPPDLTHDWVLHVSREGRKSGMLKSYKFESRRMRLPEVETKPANIPYEIELPEGEVSLRAPSIYVLRSTRANREPRNLLVEWIGEVVTSGEGYRVMGTGVEGTLRIPQPLQEALAGRLPAVLSVRVRIRNAAGKPYEINRAFRLVP